MKTITANILLASLLLPAVVVAQPQRDVFLLGEGRNNIMQNWEVPHDKWGAQPAWTPTSGKPPPLAIAKAVELGEAWLLKRHSDVKKLVVQQITLKAQAESSPRTNEGWFYRIQYQPVVAGQRLWGGEFVAVVLLDGTIIAPRAEPYSSGR